MIALLAVHLASSLLPEAGAEKGIGEVTLHLHPERAPLPCGLRAVLKGPWGEGAHTVRAPPGGPLHTTLSLYFYLFLVWSTLRLLERIFQKGFLFLNNIMGHFDFFFFFATSHHNFKSRM